jgi:hypothetical protein
MLPEEFFLDDVEVGPLISVAMSLTGDWRPDGVSSGTAICSLMLGWLTLTGNLGETLLCRPWNGFGGALIEFRCEGGALVGDGTSAGNAPGASPSASLVTCVGVGGSTSTGGLCKSFTAISFCGCAIASSAVMGVCCRTSSFFASSPDDGGELAPCVPKPVGSESCPGGLVSFSLTGARGVSTASSKASYSTWVSPQHSSGT